MSNYRPHLVKQGEYLTKIAERYGVGEAVLWSHPKNKDLSALRSNPNILAPGDILYVPDMPKTWLPLTVGKVNTFQVEVPEVRVSPCFMDGDSPRAGSRYLVEGVDAPPGTTDGNGCVHVTVPTSILEFKIVFPDYGDSYRIRVGHLYPPSTASGARQRLGALGFYDRPGGLSPIEGPEEELGFGLLQFQLANKLDVTGELDVPTVAKLVEVHGC